MTDETSKIAVSYKELAEIIMKHKNIHKGFWNVFVRFGLEATYVHLPDRTPAPAAILPITEIGIKRSKTANELTVDAAVVNPARRKSRKTRPGG